MGFFGEGGEGKGFATKSCFSKIKTCLFPVLPFQSVEPQTALIDEQPVPAGSWKVITCVLGSSYPNMSSSVQWKLGNAMSHLHLNSIAACYIIFYDCRVLIS